MKTSALFVAGLVFCSQPAFALLPPLFESIAQIKAILDAPELKIELQSGDVIESISRNESGWEIQTNKRELQIEVVSLPLKQPGPGQYEIHFQKAQPK